jgi:hypothetical protein
MECAAFALFWRRTPVLKRGHEGKMITNAQLFEYELTKLVAEQIDRLKDNLAVNTYEEVGQFKYVMGQIAALSSLQDLIDEAKQKTDKH